MKTIFYNSTKALKLFLSITFAPKVTKRLALLAFFFFASLSIFGQQSTLTISTSATSGGAFSGTAPNRVFTPSASTANIQASALVTELVTNNVTINTAFVGGTGTGNVTFNTPITAASTSTTQRTFTINAGGSITVSASSAINLTPATPANTLAGITASNIVFSAGTTISIASDITVRGGAGGPGNSTGNAANKTGGIGGNGGSITLTGPTGVSVSSALITSGGTGGTATAAGNTNGSGGNAGNITINGTSGITLNSNLTANAGAAGAVGTGGTAGTAGAFTLNDGSSTVTTGGGVNDGQTAGVISGGTLTKSGNGTFVMAGANTYTGLTTVSAGVLNIQNATATGTTAGGVTVTANAALEVQGGITVGAEALTLNGTGISSGGALRSVGTGNLTNTWGGAITLGSTARINADASSTLSIGTITGATRSLSLGGLGNINVTGAITTTTGGVTDDGPGTVTFSGTNTYTGATTISAGITSLGASNVFADTSNFVLSGGTFKTGIAPTGFSDTVGTLTLSGNFTIGLIGSLSHTLTFADSRLTTWGEFTLTIEGWTGTAGSSGTAGKIIVGTTNGGLTAAQLAKFSFTGYGTGAVQLTTGEVVPSLSVPVVTSATTASSTYGTDSSYTITGSNTPTSYGATGLPTGMSVDTATGDITVAATTAAGSYPITISAISGSGTVSATLNYTVNKKALTITGLTGSNKVYDGTTTATATGTAALSGIVLSQTVTLGGTPSYTFTSASVGTAIGITTTGYTISGAAAVNYSLTQPSALANITTASLIITADNAYKVTGTALPSPVTGSVDFSATGLVNQETVGSVTITYGTGSASNAAVGTYTGSVVPSAATDGTFNASNYTISYVSANIIVGKFITCIKTGNWSATTTWSTGAVPTLADGVIIQAPFIVTVDINYAVCASMSVNSDSGTNGANGGMATLIFNSGSVLTIEGTLSASWTGSKAGTVDMRNGGKLIINGTNNPIQNGPTPFQFYDGGVFLPGTGTVEFGGSAQTIAPYDCGGCGLKTMTYNNVIFSGSGIKTINTGTTITGNVSITGTAKVNLPAATSVPISTLTLGGRGTLNGTWGSTTATTATYKNNTYFDANSGYFTVATNTAVVPTITTAPTSSAITYGQTLASSTLSGGAASVPGTFTFTTSSTAPNAGTASQSVTFTPEDATNYISITIAVNVTVNTKALTAGSSATKVYDGGTTAGSVTVGTVTGYVGSETLAITGTMTNIYSAANVGSAYSATISYGLANGTNGGLATNYSMANLGISNASITAKALTITAPTVTKVYDGTTAAGTVTLGTVTGNVESPTIGISGAASVYSNKNVGSAYSVTVTYTLSDNGTFLASNYSAPASSVISNASITAKALTITAPTVTKEYDGTTTAGTETVGTLSGFVGTETVIATGTATAYASANVGSTYSVTVSYSLADGTNGGVATNYSLANSAISNASITAKALTVTAPIIGTITQPICALQTGSVVLSGLPVPGTWTLTRSDDSSQTTGTGTSTTIIGLASGTYTYTVSISGLTSEASANVVINTLTKTWNGTAWSPLPNDDPTSDNLVIFNGNYSSTNSVLSFCSCQVTSGAVVINSGHTLKVTNGINVSGGSLTFENDACLVQTNENPINSGNIIYKRTTSTLNNNYDFVYWSSPVKEQKIGKIWMASNWADTFYNFSPAANNWARTYEANTMIPGKGYISRARNGQSGWDYNNNVSTFTVGGTWTAKFYGVPNNGTITVTDCVAGIDCLLGNPYPSALDAGAFLERNSSVLEGTLYFWTHNNPITNNAYNSNDYALYNSSGSVATTSDKKKPTGKIAAGQSFFATAKATANVIFNNTMRVGAGGALLDNTQFFRTSSAKAKTANSIEKHRVWLNVSNTQGAFKQTLVGYVTDATNGYDSRFDGESYDGNAYVDFYSINQGKNFTIQGRAVPFDQNDTVPLGFKTTIEGSFTIDIDEVDGLLANQAVYLEDKVTNTVSNLKNGNYTFTTAKGTFNDRFVLRYTDTDTTLSIDDTDKEDGILVFYSNNYKTLIIKNKVMDSTVKSVALFNMAGQNIEKWDVKDSGQTNIQIPIKNIPSGIYIVKVKTTKGESSKKIIVN